MATDVVAMNSWSDNVIKIEDSPEPTLPPASPAVTIVADNSPNETSSTQAPSTIAADPRDPEGFLRRCSGYNKKTKVRCGQPIGKNSAARNQHPTFLPTCKNHRDQQSYAGWCQLIENGERCGRLFRWTPPYLELCEEHQGHPDTPCYFLKLPLELRLEIFSYLLPKEPIGSSLSPGHRDALPYQMPPAPFQTFNPVNPPPPPPPPPPGSYIPHHHPPLHPSAHHLVAPHARRAARATALRPEEPHRLFPFPLLDLLLVSRQVYAEVKDLLFSTVHFVIDIRKDGTFMCGRRLLEPRRADGSSHFGTDNAGVAAQRFINNFDFRAVKNYIVDIVVENGETGRVANRPSFPTDDSWDEEVEIYDIRDYVSVAVTGILGKSQNLCKLNVRVGLSGFGRWEEHELLDNSKRLVGPFESLRNVRQPRFSGVYAAAPNVLNHMVLTFPHASSNPTHGPPTNAVPHCSVPQLTTQKMLINWQSNAEFAAYKEQWERWLSQKSAVSLCRKPPIRAMFTEFKQFYTSLSPVVPDVTARVGKHAFLHRARVAREMENVESFRHLRNELIEYWYAYLEREEEKKNALNTQLSRMLDTDVYPSHEDEPLSRRNSSGSSSDSPILDVDTMVAEGIPMQGNQMNEQERKDRECMQRWHRSQQQMAQAGASGTSSSQPRTNLANLAQAQGLSLSQAQGLMQASQAQQRAQHQAHSRSLAADPQSLLNNQNITLNTVRPQALRPDDRYMARLNVQQRLQALAPAQRMAMQRQMQQQMLQALQQQQAQQQARQQQSCLLPRPQSAVMPSMQQVQTLKPITIPDEHSSSDSDRSASSSSAGPSSSSDSYSPTKPLPDTDMGTTPSIPLTTVPGFPVQGPPVQTPFYSSSENSMRAPAYSDAGRDTWLQNFYNQQPEADPSENVERPTWVTNEPFVPVNGPTRDRLAPHNSSNGITTQATSAAFSPAYYDRLDSASDMDEEMDMNRRNPNFWGRPGHHPYMTEMPTAAKRPFYQDDVPATISKRARMEDVTAPTMDGQETGGAWNGVGKGKGKARAGDEVVWLD